MEHRVLTYRHRSYSTNMGNAIYYQDQLKNLSRQEWNQVFQPTFPGLPFCCLCLLFPSPIVLFNSRFLGFLIEMFSGFNQWGSCDGVHLIHNTPSRKTLVFAPEQQPNVRWRLVASISPITVPSKILYTSIYSILIRSLFWLITRARKRDESKQTSLRKRVL